MLSDELNLAHVPVARKKYEKEETKTNKTPMPTLFSTGSDLVLLIARPMRFVFMITAFLGLSSRLITYTPVSAILHFMGQS